jgi:hypothetical protein
VVAITLVARFASTTVMAITQVDPATISKLASQQLGHPLAPDALLPPSTAQPQLPLVA